MNLYVVGLLVEHRSESGPVVQEVLTRYGEDILCRFGIPDPCKENGLINLVMEAEESTINKLAEELEDVEGVRVNSMIMR